MNFTHGYQAGRFVGEHYLDYLIGFQIGFWMGVPLAIIKQGHSQRGHLDRSGHRHQASALEQSEIEALTKHRTTDLESVITLQS